LTESTSPDTRPRVLCVDDDRDVAEVVQAILADSGYAISCLYDVSEESLRRAVGRLEPDCVLLDGVPGAEYGSWDSAAWLDQRARHIPVVMFTAHHLDVKEAEEGSSKRAREADFFAVIEKPFQIDDLLDVVAKAVGKSDHFDTSADAEDRRTQALVKALEGRGATSIEPSKRREWATFNDRNGTLFQTYWWQDRGVYQVARFGPDGKMQMLGQFTELSAAIEIALPN
jgi:FixJ family two-component response regulator